MRVGGGTESAAAVGKERVDIGEGVGGGAREGHERGVWVS